MVCVVWLCMWMTPVCGWTTGLCEVRCVSEVPYGYPVRTPFFQFPLPNSTSTIIVCVPPFPFLTAVFLIIDLL
ncbi:hypothetical protein HOY80DRAFT_956028 [Tuber brumale]|nr:hypothetical protein HOY80DRAFT_956028 [Tuber brumale]